MEPRPDLDEIIQKWEDLIWVEAMQIIHGKEMGLARYRWLRMGGPNPWGEPGATAPQDVSPR